MNTLSRMYKDPVRRELPNGGGSYLAPPAPQYSPSSGTGTVEGDYTFDGLDKGWLRTTPTIPEAPADSALPKAPEQKPARNEYINPKTGEYYTPEEYGNSIAMRIPTSKATGDVGQYAGDALAKPDASEEDLMKTARTMSNTRNDIATGTTDPYKVGAESGIAYSPAELNAIEKAYAGIYDPAINDVFTRLKKREEEKERMDRREDMIFATNESIRQWRETTGTRSTTGEDVDENTFSDTQINKGASAANMSREEFLNLDYALMNYFVNPPKVFKADTGKFITVEEEFELLKQDMKDGLVTTEEAKQRIMDGEQLDPTVKVYLINRLPIKEEEKKSLTDKILSLSLKPLEWGWNVLKQ